MLAVTWAVALGKVLWAAPPRLPAQTVSDRVLFDAMVKDEPRSWQEVQRDWAHHRWSQQDAFSAGERSRAFEVAARFGVTQQRVFMAFDEGMRQGWLGPDGRAVRATVVPLKPRSMD